MDQQELSMSSKVNTAIKEQEKEQIINMNEELCTKKRTMRHTTYDEEDCSYMLRVLEKDAFSTVVSAFRAQGMLNDYKRVLLKHLKAALFISDESYHAEIRQAANDESLSKIAQTLSPSYDTYAQWGIEGFDPIPYYDDIPIQENMSDDSDVDHSVANELLRLAKEHNEKLQDANTALHEMIALPKAPYVPERLRLLLRETESDYEGRVDALHSDEDEGSTETPRVNSGLIKAETSPFDETQQFAKITRSAEELYGNPSKKTTLCYELTPSTSTARPSSHEMTTSCPSSSSSSTPVITSGDQAVLVSKCGVQGDEDFDSHAAGEYIRPKKRRRDLSATCARVLPFRFQSSAPGQKNKPIRGNPDRRPQRQASPSGISNFTSASSLPCNLSVTGTQSSHTTALPAFRTISTNSTSNPGRFQVPHLFTSGVVIKRNRTLSSGGNETTILDGNSVFPRQVSNVQNVFRIQQPIQRAYIRSSSGQRFYASPIVSTYSNPTGPYGNPNAVVGFMRSVSSASPRSSYTISSGPSASSASHSQPQTITSSEIQRLVAQAAASRQHRSIRKTAPRPVVLTSSSRFSISNQRQGCSTSVAPFINLAKMKGANSCSLQQQQLPVQSALRVTHRTAPLSSTVAATDHAHTVASTTVDRNTSFAASMKFQRADGGNLELPQPDIDTVAAVNSIIQGDDEPVEQVHGTNMDRSVVTVNPAEISSHVRLECDEVLLPESRPVLPVYDNNPGDMQVSGLQQRVVNDLNHGSDLMSEDYSNGLIHQEGQNVINFVAASQCIQ